MKKTKGQIEAEISESVVKFEKEFMGRGPLETKTYIIEDMILVRLKNVLTQAEYQLAKTENNSEGRELIKKMRITLLEKGKDILIQSINSITGANVISLHTDISTTSGERVIIFVIDKPLFAKIKT